jgi:malonyl-CoA/methylmalonyl-CoA synthetase
MAASQLLERWLARAADPRPAVHGPSGTASWQDAVASSDRVSAALLNGRRSLEGERIALLISPGPTFLACFFGVLRAGGAAVVLTPLHPPREMRYLCDDSAVRHVLTSADLAERAAFLAPERRIVLAEGLGESAPRRAVADPLEQDHALQLYTSGTTGKPKGAVLTHANLGVQQGLLVDAWGLREDDVLLHVLPLHHMHGLVIALLSTMAAGAAVSFLPATSFDAPATWEAMRGASLFMAVPTIHAKLFAAFDAADDRTRDRWMTHARSLRLVTSGSAALPVTCGDRWRAMTGAYPLERFGMTEIGVGLSNPLAPGARRPGTVGLPLPTVGTRIVGEDGHDAEDGELWISGPSVFSGYHERPEATADAFVVESATRWFKTGDTAARDADGYIRILGRTRVDILKSGGYKVSALEVEEALREHAAVAEVAVIGVPDATWGDRVVACVVPRSGREDECAEERLREFAKERLAPYKVPKNVILVRDLPRNALGKVVKQDLLRRLEGL